jgi:hypothetical protein
MERHDRVGERILVAAEALGIGRVAIERASRYNSRIVYGHPIGRNQGIASRWPKATPAARRGACRPGGVVAI